MHIPIKKNIGLGVLGLLSVSAQIPMFTTDCVYYKL